VRTKREALLRELAHDVVFWSSGLQAALANLIKVCTATPGGLTLMGEVMDSACTLQGVVVTGMAGIATAAAVARTDPFQSPPTSIAQTPSAPQATATPARKAPPPLPGPFAPPSCQTASHFQSHCSHCCPRGHRATGDAGAGPKGVKPPPPLGPVPPTA